MAITGHCLCKAVTYSIDAENPNAVAYDHCDDCQRYTGSTYGKFPAAVINYFLFLRLY